MKKLLTTVALLAAMVSPALADEADPATLGAMRALIYDAGCAKLPDALMWAVTQKLGQIPRADFASVEKMVHDELTNFGKDGFCARVKLNVDKMQSPGKALQ